MAKELHLPNATTFGDAHSKRVLSLPGREKFRTGISLRVPSKKPLEPSKSGSLEDRTILFVSFPYFGESRKWVEFGHKRESVTLLEFKRLGVGVRGRRGAFGQEVSDDIGGISVKKGDILVHQARYMIFDNSKLYLFAYR